MSAQLLALIVLWAALSAYAVLAGADFGAGAWDLLARGQRGLTQRAALAAAMGPVWEANHVWLIFFLTGLFTVFPLAFAVVSVALYLPLVGALVGIVLRGAAFAFRGLLSPEHPGYLRFARVFGAASVLTPFLLGASAGALVGPTIRYRADTVITGGGLAVWVGPLQLLCGALAVAMCAYLAAVFMTVELTRATRSELAEAFRRRALAAGTVAGALSLAGLLAASGQAPRFFGRLTDQGLPLVLAGVIAGAVSLAAVWRRRYRAARASAALAVVAVLWGWGVAQYPRLIGRDVTVSAATASHAMVVAFLIVTAAGLALLAPALWLLYGHFRRHPIEIEHEG